jgi:hypothetical protein
MKELHIMRHVRGYSDERYTQTEFLETWCGKLRQVGTRCDEVASVQDSGRVGVKGSHEQCAALDSHGLNFLPQICGSEP